MKLKAIALSVMLCAPVSAFAEMTFSPYVGAGVESLSSTIDSVEFRSTRMLFHTGLWIAEGIGIEAELGSNISSDVEHSLALEYSSIMRYGIRLRSPAAISKISIYVLLGRASSTINLQNQDSSLEINKEVSGYHGGIGFATKISNRLQIDMSYNGYNFHENYDISGIRLTAEYTFGNILR